MREAVDILIDACWKIINEKHFAKSQKIDVKELIEAIACFREDGEDLSE